MFLAGAFVGAWPITLVLGALITFLRPSYSVVIVGMLIDLLYSVHTGVGFLWGVHTLTFFVLTIASRFVHEHFLWNT